MESLPSPVGFSFSTSVNENSINKQVVFSGVVSSLYSSNNGNINQVPLKLGLNYYTTTNGQLIYSNTSTPYYGMESIAVPADAVYNANTGVYTSHHAYVSPRLQPYAENDDVIVLNDGRMGVAVNTDSILLSNRN
jgi:hypothetical protein